jgi:AraC family transcriptional activator of pyochelin receptor
MIGLITTSDSRSIALRPSLPPHYRGVVLPGSTRFSFREAFGEVILQEFRAAQYAVSYYIFYFTEKITLLAREENFPFQSLVALKSPASLHIAGAAKLHLRESQHAFFSDTSGERKFVFEKDKEYHLFCAGYAQELAGQILPLFPPLQSSGRKKNFSLLLRPGRTICVEMLDIIHNLLHCPFEGDLQQLYFENKVREYLFLVLAKSNPEPEYAIRLSPSETTALYQAREIILADIEKHYTIGELARQVHLNEFKLKAGFRQLFGTGIFECLLEARMQKARSLLLETDQPIKQIASMTGYRRVTSFITAFRRHFGYTPGSVRRKGREM